MMHFGRTFRFMLAMGVKIFVIEEVQSYGKIVFIKKTLMKSDWWGNAYHTSPS